MHNKGVVPSDYREQFGALIKAQFKPSKWVTINASLNTIKTNYRSFGNSMSSIYAWPITNNMSYYKTPSGDIVWRDSWDGLTDQEKLDMPLNPYWSRYEDKGENNATRNIMMGEVVWNPIENLRFTGRMSYDESNSSYDGYSTPRYSKSDFTDASLANSLKTEYGEYSFNTGKSSVMNGQVIGQYSIKVANDYEFSLLLGGEFKEYKGLESSLGGYDFVIPGDFFSVQNLNSSLIDGSNLSLYHTKRRQAGYFGDLKIDYKGLAHISGTFRNDYSSTLSEKSYFYPSVTAGVIFSELFQISSSIFSYGKLRGNWARVGKDVRSPYLFDRKFYQRPTFPDQGFSVNPTASVATILNPEMCDSWEIGTDLRFFDNKTSIDVAYYSTEVNNQIVTVRVSPAAGNILETRNEGSVKNHGVEIQVNQKIMATPLFTWDAGLNFTLNRGKLTKLPEGLGELQGTQYGDAFTSAYLNKSTMSISGKDYLRNPEGKIICTADGIPMINPAKGVWIGDREPDFLLGLTSNFRWKDLTVSFMFDTRKGGDVLNVTKRSMLSNGQLKLLETYRNRWIVIDGVVDNGDGTYSPNKKPMLMNQTNINNYIYNVTSNFVEDGSYVRLSYVTLGYDLSRYVKKAMKGLRVSVTGRNLFLWTHYSGADPAINANPSAQGTGSKGIDNFGVPATRSFNFTVNATF